MLLLLFYISQSHSVLQQKWGVFCSGGIFKEINKLPTYLSTFEIVGQAATNQLFLNDGLIVSLFNYVKNRKLHKNIIHVSEKGFSLRMH